MNLSRWIVVPITTVVVFLIGWGCASLIGLIWKGMPEAVRWGIPAALVVWYLIDAMRREMPQK